MQSDQFYRVLEAECVVQAAKLCSPERLIVKNLAARSFSVFNSLISHFFFSFWGGLPVKFWVCL